ncbi:acyl-CoA dehydrogenase family protein [Agrobacterium vitis]|uniref:acyl-CoA dehydrogenase family protein n=1 Tax=Agrobacterium vitis TaxID=373 RepID=UPI0015D9C86C|nr:acyl-CoA dehydrogenase family protein [Agrobacterium vitis]MCF1455821.1 acyl-CoA dehydrogenase [Agrobacterium vitis]BCH56779.1 acyl-CoA dehydrogenase [Agrobacterium vitis]
MIKRSIFSPSDESWRLDVANFLDSEIAPYYGIWEKDGRIPRDAWLKAGRAGLLCRTAPKNYGGQGAGFLESVVIAEELGKRRFSGFLTFLQSDILAPYFLRLADDQQKEAYLPGLCSGSKIGALAVTEPQSGSEVRRIRTTISRNDAGLVVNGHKMHISNGFSADVLLVAGRNGAGMKGAEAEISLLIVDTDTPGIVRTPIDKSGMRALDTCELTFENVCVPAQALLGGSGKGLLYFFTFIGLERLMLAIYAQASAVAILQELLTFCAGRKTSAGSILDYQFVHCKLADLYGECTVNQAFIDACIIDQARGRHDAHAASLAKLRTTETLKAVALLAVQFRGALGVSGASGERATQDMIDSCVQSIWGGASEVLRDAIGKGLINGI